MTRIESIDKIIEDIVTGAAQYNEAQQIAKRNTSELSPNCANFQAGDRVALDAFIRELEDKGVDLSRLSLSDQDPQRSAERIEAALAAELERPHAAPLSV